MKFFYSVQAMMLKYPLSSRRGVEIPHSTSPHLQQPTSSNPRQRALAIPSTADNGRTQSPPLPATQPQRSVYGFTTSSASPRRRFLTQFGIRIYDAISIANPTLPHAPAHPPPPTLPNPRPAASIIVGGKLHHRAAAPVGDVGRRDIRLRHQ